jgi:hypothetical protein
LVLLVVAAAAGSVGSQAALAADADTSAPVSTEKTNWAPLGLQSYEPSALGYTKNNDDVSFENIRLSVKFPLMPHLTQEYLHGRDQFFLSFTGYLGFYVSNRPSGPVVGKEYNPQIFWQHNLACHPDSGTKYKPGPIYGVPASSSRDPRAESGSGNEAVSLAPLNCYVALGYNHDSNGQSIDSEGQFLQAQATHGTEAAKDAISRGWDFLRLTARYIPYWSATDRITLYPSMKYFLDHGLVQGAPEELHDWEHPPDAKPRKEVDGLSILSKYQRRVAGFDAKFAVAYTTGYRNPLRFSTVRLEAGVAIFELPIVVWAQKGYMSDLAQYYRKVTGYGIEMEVGAF